MALWNLGSVATAVLTRIEGIPTGISGALVEIANETRQDILQYTGLDPGSVDITLKFQPVMFSLTASEALGEMQLQGMDASQIKLGDLSVTKGTTSNLTVAQNYYVQKGDLQLKRIGWKSRNYKSNG